MRLTKRTDTEFIELVEETNGLDHKTSVKHAIHRLADLEDKETLGKPNDVEKGYDGDYGYCPNCRSVICDFADFYRCRKCGQVIDWSDT